MAADNNSDLLPLLGDDVPHFDIAMRGYDRRQVDDYVERAEAEIAEVQAARDAALAVSADRAAQLASAAAHMESLKRQAAKASEAGPTSVSERIRDMLQLANEEAAQTRRGAEEEAERVLAAAKADAERVRGEAAAEQQRLTASASQRSAEADQKLAQARVHAKSEIDNAQAEIDRLRAEADAERARLDSEAADARREADAQAEHARALANEDFEITLRSRRTAADQQATADHEAASALAASIVDQARTEAARLEAERARIHQSLLDLQARLDEVVTGATGTRRDAAADDAAPSQESPLTLGADER